MLLLACACVGPLSQAGAPGVSKSFPRSAVSDRAAAITVLRHAIGANASEDEAIFIGTKNSKLVAELQNRFPRRRTKMFAAGLAEYKDGIRHKSSGIRGVYIGLSESIKTGDFRLMIKVLVYRDELSATFFDYSVRRVRARWIVERVKLTRQA